MTRKKTSFYTHYPTSVVDGRKVVGNLIKETIEDPDKPGYIKYRDKITIERSTGNTGLSQDSQKYKQKIVKEYNPDIMDTRSRVHTKKYGSKYTIILDCSEIFIEISQIGHNDDQVRLIRLGSADQNSCFIPDVDIRFENKPIEFKLLCEYIGVNQKTLLDQCKAIASKFIPLVEYEADNFHQLERKKLVKKTQIR